VNLLTFFYALRELYFQKKAIIQVMSLIHLMGLKKVLKNGTTVNLDNELKLPLSIQQFHLAKVCHWLLVFK